MFVFLWHASLVLSQVFVSCSMHFNSVKCNSYKFSLALPEVSSEVMRFIKPSSACLIFESERKILVLTKLLHVRIGRLNLHSFCPEIIMVVSDFLQLHLLFPPARGLLQSSDIL